MKKLIRDRHNNGGGWVWYIFDTVTKRKQNTYHTAHPCKDNFSRKQMEKIFQSKLI